MSEEKQKAGKRYLNKNATNSRQSLTIVDSNIDQIKIDLAELNQ
jgi:hypothetical protein